MRLGQAYVVRELVDYYHTLKDDLKPRTLRIFRLNSDNGPYCGAYALAFKQIREDAHHGKA